MSEDIKKIWDEIRRLKEELHDLATRRTEILAKHMKEMDTLNEELEASQERVKRMQAETDEELAKDE